MVFVALPLGPTTLRVIQPPPPACHAWAPICLSDAHPGAAGYLQAIGALLLIAVAIYQSLSDYRRKAAEIRTFVDLCREAMNDVRTVLEPFINWACRGTTWDQGFLDLNIFYGSPANDTLKRILELPLSQWPALTLYTRMRGMQHVVAATRPLIDPKIGADGNFIPTDAIRAQAKAIMIALCDFDQTADRVDQRPLVRMFKRLRVFVI